MNSRHPQNVDRPPSVDVLARDLVDVGIPHPLLVDAAREAIAAGDPSSARSRAESLRDALLRPVVNATGVLLHTNLGRAPLPAAAPGATEPAVRYTNLELDVASGRRGSRSAHAASLLARVVGAEAVHVVNNGAAALLLVLSALGRGRSVVVSRGELVEIGGGFRVPEVMEHSGARLVEVGTTNRTRLGDYRSVTDEGGTDVALILKVHQSNYRITGFTESVEVSPLAALGPPVVADIGSGLLDASTPWIAGGPPRWLADEPAARQTLAAGAALVTFSGDKLMGGPQAGIIAGRADLVSTCAQHPLSRALRPGALVLSALQETAMAYLRRDAAAIPFWKMVEVPVNELRQRAARIGMGRVVDTMAVAGGGSVPGEEVPSAGLEFDGDLTGVLRAGDPPVLARVAGGHTICDLRTVDPADDDVLASALASALCT